MSTIIVVTELRSTTQQMPSYADLNEQKTECTFLSKCIYKSKHKLNSQKMYSQWSHTSWLRGGCLPITVRPANWRSMRLRYWSLGTKKNSCSKPMNACTPLTPCRICMKEYVHCSEIGCADEDTQSSNVQFISVVTLPLWGIFRLRSG